MSVISVDVSILVERCGCKISSENDTEICIQKPSYGLSSMEVSELRAAIALVTEKRVSFV